MPYSLGEVPPECTYDPNSVDPLWSWLPEFLAMLVE